MSNLSIKNTDRIRHNNKDVLLMRLNGETVYKRGGFFVEYRVSNNADFYLYERCLPYLYSSKDIIGGYYDYTRIEIIKHDGTMTSDTNTNISQIKKVKLWFPEIVECIKFAGFARLEADGKISSLLTGIDYINTSNINDMNSMFDNCWTLTELDASTWDVSNVTDMRYLFNNCSGLTKLNLSSWNPVNITKASSMFYGCSNLKTLIFSGFDMSEATSLSSSSLMFTKCTALENFEPPKNINRSLNFGDCTNLTHDSLMKIINNLATMSSTTTLYIGETNLAKLTNAERLIAINKGWTLA